MRTVLLLIGSNIFMTTAWYGHLKFKWLADKPLMIVILVSWGIAFFEYLLQVPANRIGYRTGQFDPYQLKVIQEAVTLSVFIGFAWVVFGEKLRWNYAVSFSLIFLAVVFAMAVKPGATAVTDRHRPPTERTWDR
ncbi:MAG: DMT family protein [Opitutaceae bacterium]